MSQGDGPRHEGAEGDTKLACLQGDVLGTGVPKATRSLHSDVARHEGAKGDTKLACRKTMWLGTEVPKATQSLRVAERCG
ncbi:unnamed protein product [Prunus armeniaca]